MSATLWCEECGGAVELGACAKCGEEVTRYLSMSELHEALVAKGYEATREPGYGISIKISEEHRAYVGGDEYPDDLAHPDNLSWYWIDSEEEEEEVTVGGYYDDDLTPEPFTVETIVHLIADFIENS